MNSIIHPKLLPVFILAAVTFFIYSFKLSAPLDSMDDQVLIVNNGAIVDFSQVKDIFTRSFFPAGNYYRPGVLLSYIIEFHFFRLNAFYYNLDNILIHIFNVLLVFYLVERIWREKWISFLTALLFAVHPIHWEAVACVSGRPILLCGFFFLASLLSYSQNVSQPKNGIWYFLSLIFFSAGLFCKEEMVILPVLILFVEWFLVPKLSGPDKIWDKWFRLIPFGLLMIIYFLWRKIIGIGSMNLWPTTDLLIKGVGTFFKGLFIYVKTLLFPTDIYYDRSLPYFQNFTDVYFWLTVLCVIVMGRIIILKRFQWGRSIKFFVVWILLTFLPVSQLVPISVRIGYASWPNHFFYLPSIGIFALTVYGLARQYALMPQMLQRWLIVLITGMFLFFILITIKQNVIVTQETGMLKQTLSFEPDNIRVRHGLAMYYVNDRNWEKAEHQFRILLSMDPTNIGARINLGRILYEEKRYEEARQQLDMIQEAGPLNDLLMLNRNVVNHKLK